MEQEKCPKCNCDKIGKGKIGGGYASMMPLGKIFSMGSDIIADICTHCGYILGMKVKRPDKFKDTY